MLVPQPANIAIKGRFRISYESLTPPGCGGIYAYGKHSEPVGRLSVSGRFQVPDPGIRATAPARSILRQSAPFKACSEALMQAVVATSLPCAVDASRMTGSQAAAH